MKRRLTARRARGAAAVELALVVLAVGVMLPWWWKAGHTMMQYGAIRAAAFDAANLIAQAAPSELATSAGVNLLEARAESLVEDAVEAGGNELTGMTIECLPLLSCAANEVQTVRVTVIALEHDGVFPEIGDQDGNRITVTVETSYAGRPLSP